MQIVKSLVLVTCIGLASGCAAVIPKELVSARQAYRRASVGIAAENAPAELHVASEALAKAEQAFEDEADSYRTRDLAYVAERMSQVAEATGSSVDERKGQVQARADYETAQGAIISSTQQDLGATRAALAASERGGEVSAEQLRVERSAHTAAEQRSVDALAALAKLATVSAETRGTVVTFLARVLFEPDGATMVAGAETRLGELATVLLTSRERTLSVEGHSASQASDRANRELSQLRADAVRDYLVQRGYPATRIAARGLGQGSGADDAPRASDDRVDLVIEKDTRISER